MKYAYYMHESFDHPVADSSAVLQWLWIYAFHMPLGSVKVRPVPSALVSL